MTFDRKSYELSTMIVLVTILNPGMDVQAVLLDDGNVLVTGGAGSTAQNSSEIWLQNLGQWITIAPLPDPKINFGIAQFTPNRFLAFGGSVNSSVTSQTGTNTSFIFTTPFTSADLAPFLAVEGAAAPPGLIPIPFHGIQKMKVPALQVGSFISTF